MSPINLLIPFLLISQHFNFSQILFQLQNVKPLTNSAYPFSFLSKHFYPTDPDSIHQCKICYRYHSLRFCRQFLAMEPADRNRVARRHNYCVNCLARTHLVRNCKCPDTCLKCGRLHHTLLHPGSHPRVEGPNRHPRVHAPLNNQPVDKRPQKKVKAKAKPKPKRSNPSQSTQLPNQHILSAAIKTLAEVLCHTPHTSTVAGRRHV